MNILLKASCLLFFFFAFAINGTAQSGNATPGDSVKPYSLKEGMPEYPGGLEAMKKFISGSLKYPKEAEEKKITGTVIVGFVVDKDGSVKDAHIVKGLDKSCDAEAVRIVKLMPKWKPGTQNGKPVIVPFNLPINFIIK